MRIGKISYAEFKVGSDPLDPSNDSRDGRRLAEVSCPLEKRAKLTSLVASAGAKRSTSFRDAGHDEVPADKSQHFYFAPGVEPLALTWVVENPEKVTGAAITVYSKAGDGAAIWSGVLDGNAIAAGTGPWAGPTLTAKDSPYAIQMTLTDGTIVGEYSTAWTYVDVLLAEEIALEWGDPGEIPNTRAEGYLVDLAWTLREEAATLAKLRSPDGQNVAPVTGDHEVLLEGNLFRNCNNTTGPVGGAHTSFATFRAHWGDGPRIPIVAKVRVLSSADAPVFAPDAVGALDLVWDWEDPRANAADLAWHAWVDLAKTTSLNRAALAMEVVRRHPLDEPPSHNCPNSRGGRAGSGVRVLPAVQPGTRFKGTVTALQGEGRDWAAVTRVGSDPAKPGQATMLFHPSRMAGDQYKLRVYLREAALDLSKTAPQLWTQAEGLHTPRARTGTFEVWRRVTVYSVHLPGVNASWNTIRDSIYRPGGLALDVVDTPMTAQQYEAALGSAIQTVLAGANFFDAELMSRVAIDRGRTDCTAPVLSYQGMLQKLRGVIERHGVYKIRVSSNAWFGVVIRPADGAMFHVLEVETVGAKHWALLLPLDGDTLHKGDRIEIRGNHASSMALGDDPDMLTLTERRAAFERALKNPTGLNTHVQGLAAYSNDIGQLGWVKAVSTLMMDNLAAQLQPNVTRGAFVFQFERASLMDAPGGSCIWKLSGVYKSFAWAATPAADPTWPLMKSSDVVVAHEAAHMMHLQHALNTLRENIGRSQLTGEEVEQHVPYAPCLMSYDHDADRLCGLCILNLRGWNVQESHRAVSAHANFNDPGVMNLLQADINAQAANPWHKVRYYTVLNVLRKHVTARDTHKANAALYVAAVEGGAQAASTRISVLRNVILHWIDWLDTCAAVPNKTVHGLYRELVGLTSRLADVGYEAHNGRTQRGLGFCGHKVTPVLALTTPPALGARAVYTLRAVPVVPNGAQNWVAEPFDGEAELTGDRASLGYFDAANQGNAVATSAVAGARVGGLGLAVYVEDGAPAAAQYDTHHTLNLTGGSVHIEAPPPSIAPSWPAVLAPRKLKVTPAIEYVGDAVLVGADATRTPRRPLRLKCDKTFDGTGVFRCSHPGLEFWDAAVGGAKVVFDGVANVFPGATLFAGKQLYVSATSESQSVNDVVLRLTLNPGKTPLDTSPATRKLTAVLCKLSACNTPLGRGSLGARVSDDLKLAPGRFVHKQANGKHARIPVIIEKARPNDYKGKLCLQETSAVSRLGLYKSATPARREAALDYYTITNDDVPDTGYVLWVEGKTTSGALADAVLDLGIKDGKGDGRDYFEGGDQVKVTVVELTSMTVDPPVTPPLHPGQYRHVVSGAAQPVTNRAPVRPAAAARNASDTLDLTAGAGPLVLMEGSGAVAADQRAAALSAQCALAVAVVPAAAQAHVRWKALRHEGDKAAVKLLSQPPTVTAPDAANHPEAAVLNTNGVGGFHVVAYVDPDGGAIDNWHFAEGRHPPCFIANVVLVRATVVGVPAAACNAGAYSKLDGTANDDADFGAHFINLKPLNLSADVDLIGAGADAKLGLDKVVCGWVQNTVAASYPATYRCNGSDVSVHLRFVENPTVAVNKFHGQDFIAYPGAHPFVELTTPFLDTIKEARAARFDAPKPAMGSSAQADAGGALHGQRRTLTMSDAPTRTVEGWHPNSRYRAQGARLTGFQWDLQFRAHITVATQDASDLYTTLGYIDWRARLDWTTTVHANRTQNTYAENTALAVTAQPAVVHPAPIMGVDAGAEFCWPSMIFSQLWDATDDPLNLGAP